MKRPGLFRSIPASLVLLLYFAFFPIGRPGTVSGEDGGGMEKEEDSEMVLESLPISEKEALGRARWLHEAIHGALQVMHRDFFGDGEDEEGSGSLSLPSQSLEDVFKEMARSWQVEVQWLGVNATKDIDHKPSDAFEKAAAEALNSGEVEYSAVERNRFRFVGAIKLQNQCLKCHVPNRTSLEDRVAGLALSFPLAISAEQ